MVTSHRLESHGWAVVVADYRHLDEPSFDDLIENISSDLFRVSGFIANELFKRKSRLSVKIINGKFVEMIDAYGGSTNGDGLHIIQRISNFNTELLRVRPVVSLQQNPTEISWFQKINLIDTKL